MQQDLTIQREILSGSNGEVVELNKAAATVKSSHVGFDLVTAEKAIAKFQELKKLEVIEQPDKVVLPELEGRGRKKAYPTDGVISFMLTGGLWIELHWGTLLAVHK